jgi:hypothetical protein
VTLALLTACARPAGDGMRVEEDEPGATGSGSAAPDPDGLVLRVRQEGGFLPPERIVGRIPEVSVYADGRVITLGPQIAVYPGPALPNLQVLRLDPAEVGRLVDEATTAGVRPGADFGRPGVADAPTTVVTVAAADGTRTVSVEALGEAQPDDPQLTPAQQQARARLAAFVQKLRDMPAADQQPYRPETLAALAQPYAEPDDGLPEQPGPVAWPGPALPGEYLNPAVEIGCVTAAGAQLDEVLAVVQNANQNTPWTSGSGRYTVTFRPLLPDESGCADLKAAR